MHIPQMTNKNNDVQADTTVDSLEQLDNQLSAFQRDLLVEIARLESADKRSYGLAIKNQLETRYGDEINHGRLYPNLDELDEMEIINKSKIDDRTNEYLLTDTGYEYIKKRYHVLEKVIYD